MCEYARLQQYPDGWGFEGGSRQQYLQSGNAVPLRLGEAAGKSIREAMDAQRPGVRPLRAVTCSKAELLDRLAMRPRTVLNPVRMRDAKGLAEAKEWLGGRTRRVEVLYYAGGNAEANDTEVPRSPGLAARIV